MKGLDFWTTNNLMSCVFYWKFCLKLTSVFFWTTSWWTSCFKSLFFIILICWLLSTPQFYFPFQIPWTCTLCTLLFLIFIPEMKTFTSCRLTQWMECTRTHKRMQARVHARMHTPHTRTHTQLPLVLHTTVFDKVLSHLGDHIKTHTRTHLRRVSCSGLQFAVRLLCSFLVVEQKPQLS